MNDSIRSRVVEGVMWVTVGRIVAQVVITGGNLGLARILTPDVFGVFAVCSFVVGVVGLLTSLPFGHAIVHSPSYPSNLDLKGIFTFQLIMGGVGWVAVGIISGAVGNYYAENVTGLMWVLGASLMLGNVKVLPSFLMEKEMKYAKVVWIEIAEVLATQGMNLIGAGIGWGVMSFAWGVVVGKLVGIVVAVGVSGWKIWGVTRVWTGVKHNFRFALNLQLNNAVGYLGGALVPVVVGKVVGLETVGLLGWAGGIAMGLRMFSEATARVVFPATAKVAHDSSRTKKLIKRSLLASIVLSWPLILGFGLFARPVIQWLFLPEWWKGMGVLYAALVYSLVAVIESVLTRVSLGLGWADLVRNASLWSGFITWIVAIVMLYHVGIVGVVLGQICGSLVSTLVLANRLTKLDLK